jgi:hypothetical protein
MARYYLGASEYYDPAENVPRQVRWARHAFLSRMACRTDLGVKGKPGEIREGVAPEVAVDLQTSSGSCMGSGRPPLTQGVSNDGV